MSDIKNTELITQEERKLFIKDFSIKETEYKVLTDLVAKNASYTELSLFMKICQKTGLDPFTKQIYFQKRFNNKKIKNEKGEEVWIKEPQMIIITGIDGYRSVASRNNLLAGMDDPIFEMQEEGKYPKSAKITVYKMVDAGNGAKMRVPFTATAYWDEFVIKDKKYIYDKGLKKESFVVRDIWDKMPHNQLAKCAEALALRKAFSQDLSGVYIEDEINEKEGEVIQVEAEVVDNTPKYSANFEKWLSVLSKEPPLIELAKMYIKLSKAQIFTPEEKAEATKKVSEYIKTLTINDDTMQYVEKELGDDFSIFNNLFKNN